MSRIYDTRRWRRLARAKLAEDPACRPCLERGVVRPATQVDHRVAINRGGDPWDFSNLVSMCAACHSRKTSYIEVQGKARVPIRGCDPATGRPLDPLHPWNLER